MASGVHAREVRMKLVFGVVTPIFLLFASIASVASETCLTRAQRCVDRWGSPHTACYGTFRLEACEKPASTLLRTETSGPPFANKQPTEAARHCWRSWAQMKKSRATYRP